MKYYETQIQHLSQFFIDIYSKIYEILWFSITKYGFAELNPSKIEIY